MFLGRKVKLSDARSGLHLIWQIGIQQYFMASFLISYISNESRNALWTQCLTEHNA